MGFTYEPRVVPTVAVQTPVYRGAAAPSTVSARRKAFVGWLGESLAPKELLTDALRGRRHTAVVFQYHVGGSNVSFTSGAAPAEAQTTTINLNNGWSVKVAAPAPRGLFADRGALMWLVGGTVLSLLAAVLMFVIRTARTRAQSLVRKAQHDDLTGLPNRALVLEHAERLLADGRLAAVMFIDVDGFKQVNDGFGHAAGDALLQAVARRLRAAIRLQDMVGRLGGDEFVVLLDAAAGQGNPQALGQRLVQAVREPIRLDGGMVVSVCASVGISTHARASVSQILHDADVAVYAAKAAGKGCYRVFEPGMEIAIAKLNSASDGEAGRAATSARKRHAVAA